MRVWRWSEGVEVELGYGGGMRVWRWIEGVEVE